MAPEARLSELRHVPGGVVDHPSVAAIFDLEARRRHQVEREHPVVGVPPQHSGQHVALAATIETCSDVVDFVDLEHDVAQTSWRSHQSKRMMPLIAVQKD